MSERIGVVINPTARAGRGQHSGQAALRALRERGHDVVDLSAGSLPSATARARQAVVEGLAALVVVGGDGMTHLGVNVVAGTGLPLGIIAVGTGNDIATCLGLPTRDIESSVTAIEEALEAGPWPVDAVRVSTPDALASQWYLGVLSAGFDAAVNELTNSLTWPRGEKRYWRAIFTELTRFAPYGYRVTVDGEVWESAGTIVSVANTTLFGGGIPISPNSRVDDGLLDIIMAGPVSRSQLLRLLPRVQRGRHLSHPVVSVRQGTSVLIEPTDAGQRPPVAYADGERIGELPLLCQLVAGAVPILARRPAGDGAGTALGPSAGAP